VCRKGAETATFLHTIIRLQKSWSKETSPVTPIW
jgi:hypothetical protein